MQSDNPIASEFQKELSMGPGDFEFAFSYVSGSDGDFHEASKQIATVFQARVPGAIPMEEVEKRIDLDHWKVRLGNAFVHLQVRNI